MHVGINSKWRNWLNLTSVPPAKPIAECRSVALGIVAKILSLEIDINIEIDTDIIVFYPDRCGYTCHAPSRQVVDGWRNSMMYTRYYRWELNDGRMSKNEGQSQMKIYPLCPSWPLSSMCVVS